MTSCVPLCVWALLALLFLNETNRAPQVQAAVPTVFCRDKRFEQGEIITTKYFGDSPRDYCGSPVGWFYAVKVNTLFHLQCSPGADSPSQATAKLINVNVWATRASTFDSLIMCDIQYPQGDTTGKNAYLIAQKLADSVVPYDRESCSARHYIEYMAYGEVTADGVKSSCPVFEAFNSDSTVNAPDFRLAGKDVYYEWPTVKGGALTVSTVPKSPSSGSLGPPKSRKGISSPLKKQASPRSPSSGSLGSHRPRKGVWSPLKKQALPRSPSSGSLGSHRSRKGLSSPLKEQASPRSPSSGSLSSHRSRKSLSSPLKKQTSSSSRSKSYWRNLSFRRSRKSD